MNTTASQEAFRDTVHHHDNSNLTICRVVVDYYIHYYVKKPKLEPIRLSGASGCEWVAGPEVGECTLPAVEPQVA